MKKLRDLTGAGMMDCKKALVENDGDFEKAAEALRVKGAAKMAARGAERDASNGLVVAQDGALIELRAETDFVAKNADFQALAAARSSPRPPRRGRPTPRPSPPTELSTAGPSPRPSPGCPPSSARSSSSAASPCLDGPVAVYLHKRAADLPPQVGVLVAYEGSEEAARAAAMQIAAMRALVPHPRRGARPT